VSIRQLIGQLLLIFYHQQNNHQTKSNKIRGKTNIKQQAEIMGYVERKAAVQGLSRCLQVANG